MEVLKLSTIPPMTLPSCSSPSAVSWLNAVLLLAVMSSPCGCRKRRIVRPRCASSNSSRWLPTSSCSPSSTSSNSAWRPKIERRTNQTWVSSPFLPISTRQIHCGFSRFQCVILWQLAQALMNQHRLKTEAQTLELRLHVAQCMWFPSWADALFGYLSVFIADYHPATETMLMVWIWPCSFHPLWFLLVSNFHIHLYFRGFRIQSCHWVTSFGCDLKLDCLPQLITPWHCGLAFITPFTACKKSQMYTFLLFSAHWYSTPVF